MLSQQSVSRTDKPLTLSSEQPKRLPRVETCNIYWKRNCVQTPDLTQINTVHRISQKPKRECAGLLGSVINRTPHSIGDSRFGLRIVTNHGVVS